MDELFQKAAENYPLKTDKGDWAKVAQRLEKSSSASTVFFRFNRRYLSILAALFLLIAGGFYVNFSFTNNKIAETIQQKKNKTGGDTSSGNSIPPGRESRTNSTVNNDAPIHGKRTTGERFKATATLVMNARDQTNEERRNKGRDAYTNELLNVNVADAAINFNHAGEKRGSSSLQTQIPVPENKSDEKSISDSVKESTNDVKFSHKKNNAGRLYAGIIIGPQLNQVKGQGFNKVGGELGLLFGYAVTKKISVESGLILSNKKYYSDGQYFNMEKISPSMPPSMKIMAVESKATLLEIPLKGMYKLVTKKNGNLFITAGASSYLLLHEQNNYRALVNGGQQDLKGDYRTIRKYFATSINLSAGYEKNLGERALIRAEPYLEFPLKGLGVGSMSIFGAGLHLGFTFPVRKK